MNENIISFPVEPQDIFNYLVDQYSANNQLTYILRTDGRVNENILEQAIRLSIEVQPILGCRLIEKGEIAIWEQRKDLKELQLCSLVETQDLAGEIQKFIALRYDFDHDSQVKVRIIRGVRDVICIKVYHACCDAGGMKEYLQLLNCAYRQIITGEEENMKFGFSNSRSQDSIFKLPKVIAKINAMTEEQDTLGNTVSFPYRTGENTRQAVAVRQLRPHQLDSIKLQGKKSKATINDVCLAACSRALGKIAEIKNEIVSLCFTADLRKYLPQEEKKALCNFSGMNVLRIKCCSQESFEETLDKVLSQTKKIKEDCPGINMALYFETLGKLTFKEADNQVRTFCEEATKTRFCNPWFSNVGILAEHKIMLGSVGVEDCYMIGTASFSPGIMILASTYNGTLTLTVNFFQSTMDKKHVEKLLDMICSDLTNWAGV